MFQRLLEKKRRNKSNDLNASSVSNVSNKSRKSNPEYILKLYQTGVSKFKNRQKVYNDKKSRDSEEYKNFSYKPELYSKPDISQNKEFHERAYNWRKNVDHRIDKNRRNIEELRNSGVTFKPKINKEILKNDQKFINKRLSQIEDYVIRRRNSLSKQKEEEDYKKNKFASGVNYTNKPTVHKEFKFSELSSRDNSRNKPISDMRKQTNTIDYYVKSDNYEGSIEFKKESRVDKSNIKLDGEFMKAVSNLQQKLYSLKL
jgi:hypothetical protein